MQTPEQLKFIEDNKETIWDMVEKANSRRERTGFPILSEDEVGAAISGMMEVLSQGKDIRTYKFPAPDPSAQVIRAPRQIPATTPNGDCYSFSVMKCANGFTLNLNFKGRSDTFIFRDLEELSEVFKNTVFKKESENGSERGNASSSGREAETGQTRGGSGKPTETHSRHSPGDRGRPSA